MMLMSVLLVGGCGTRGGWTAKEEEFQEFQLQGSRSRCSAGMSTDDLVKLFTAHARRRFQRGLKRKPMDLIKKLCKAICETPSGEKPALVRTHLQKMIIVPEMIGSILGIYNGKQFTPLEIKAEMMCNYLVEFSISYKLVKHGRPGIGATQSSRFVLLK